MLDKRKIINDYIRREYKGPYHTVLDDSVQYDLLEAGDPRAIDEAMKMFLSEKVGVLSYDEVRNARYIFICGLTLLTRAAIHGGMEASRAYSLSDAFIQRADLLSSIKDIKSVYREAWESFLDEVRKARAGNALSKLTYQVVQYIYDHLHEKVSLKAIARHFGYSEPYVSTLFRKEVGTPIKRYIIDKKLETAGALLVSEPFAVEEISDILSFSSPSHFIDLFSRKYGMTPREWRNANYR